MTAPEGPEFFQSLFDAIPVPAFAVDEDVRILHLNRAAAELAGPERPALNQRGGEVLACLQAVNNPEGCGRGEACQSCVIRGSVVSAAAGGRVYRREAQVEVAGPELRVLDLRVTASPFHFQGRGHVLLILEDMTAEKRARAEEAARHRLQGVLEMAGAAAHETSQPLQVVLGESELLLAGMAPDDPRRPAVERVQAAAGRLADIVGQIQRVTRYQTMAYLGGKRIIDLKGASGGGGGEGQPA
jgi:signal transduction histidine kinase